jgi:hypothetical protein
MKTFVIVFSVLLLIIGVVVFANARKQTTPPALTSPETANYEDLSIYPFSQVLSYDTQFYFYVRNFVVANEPANSEGHIQKIRFKVLQYNFLTNTFVFTSPYFERNTNTTGNHYNLYDLMPYANTNFDYPARLIIEVFVYRSGAYTWEVRGYKDVFTRDPNI